MLIDWITASLDQELCPDWVGWRVLRTWGDRILRVDASGHVVWETAAWDSVRSDSHQVMMHANRGSLRVQGSPARAMGLGDAVFGSGDGGRDLCCCLVAMLGHISRAIRVFPMPSPRLFRVSRVDVTGNYRMSSLSSVRVALSELRGVEGGRYRVSQQAGDTVYWSHLSRYRSGKAYAKGPHLRYMMRSKGYVGYQYTEDEITLAEQILRLELRLGSKFWNEYPKPWYSVRWDELQCCHSGYFERMLGSESMGEAVRGVDMCFVEKCVNVAPSVGQGKAAARTWAVIQSCGWQAARDSMPKSSWYRHLSILRAAGLGDADISAGRVISLRRPLVLHPVTSWAELRDAA